jgi:hypothetical protein
MRLDIWKLTIFMCIISWWEVPKHDKALLEAICKHGIGRTDLIIEDPELPFYQVKQSLVGDDEETEGEEEEDKNKALNSKFVWPRDLVVARRIDSLCDLVLNPKPLTIRQTRKRKTATGTSAGGGGRKKTKVDPAVKNDNEELLSEEEMDEDEEEEEAYEEDEGNAPSSPAAQDDISQVSQTEPQEEPKSEIMDEVKDEVKEDEAPVKAEQDEAKAAEDQVMEDEQQDVMKLEE